MGAWNIVQGTVFFCLVFQGNVYLKFTMKLYCYCKMPYHNYNYCYSIVFMNFEDEIKCSCLHVYVSNNNILQIELISP